jgi:UDP-N-acetyl-D-mannosaminuronic acid dehydrogenase
MPDVCVVGLGYIGLPTAAIIARSGARVLGVDVSPEVVATINRGEIHIEEVDLDGLVRGVVQRGLLVAAETVQAADAFVIAVPTPFARDGKHTPDISFVLSAAQEVARVLRPGNIIILESTSPVGTTEQMRDLIASLRPDLKLPGLTRETPDIAIAYCPERVLPGRILEELANNDRSIGGITPRCARKALSFCKRFVRGTCVTTDARSAEMTKLVENAYRDVNIAFANELSIIADAMGLDVWEVIRLANRHPRATELVESAPGAKVACLGLAFKANIDDFRESPARLVAATLARRFGERIHAVEPHAAQLPKEFTDTGAQLIDIDTALEDRDVLIVLVDHDVFKAVPLAERADKLVYDTRGIWPDQPVPAIIAGEMRKAG